MTIEHVQYQKEKTSGATEEPSGLCGRAGQRGFIQIQYRCVRSTIKHTIPIGQIEARPYKRAILQPDQTNVRGTVQPGPALEKQ